MVGDSDRQRHFGCTWFGLLERARTLSFLAIATGRAHSIFNLLDQVKFVLSGHFVHKKQLILVKQLHLKHLHVFGCLQIRRTLEGLQLSRWTVRSLSSLEFLQCQNLTILSVDLHVIQ